MKAVNLVIPVFNDRRTRAWPKHASGGRARYVPLRTALTQRYNTDAHFACYSVPAIARRLSKAAVEHVGVPLVIIAFDIDSRAHRTGLAATDVWFVREKKKLTALTLACPGAFVFRTRGGYRIVYRLSEPFIVREPPDALAWSRAYLLAICFIAQRFAIVADAACADWTRLFRSPRATRDPAHGPEQREVMGNPAHLGVWRQPKFGEEEARIVARSVAGRHPAWQRVVRRFDPTRRATQIALPRRYAGYVRAALRSATARIATAPIGCRNDTLNREAFSLTRFVRSGQIHPDLLLRILCSAAQNADLTEFEARATVDSAMQAGLRDRGGW